jgi:hypothetical protein
MLSSDTLAPVASLPQEPHIHASTEIHNNSHCIPLVGVKLRLENQDVHQFRHELLGTVYNQ